MAPVAHDILPLDNLELERTVDKVFGQEIKGTLKSAAVVNTAIQLRGDEAGTIDSAAAKPAGSARTLLRPIFAKQKRQCLLASVF